jgi:hypothetical protein
MGAPSGGGPTTYLVAAAPAIDWAQGHWSVRLRTRGVDALFPPRELALEARDADDNDNAAMRRRPWFSLGLQRRHTYDALSLVLFGNGTFCLSPPSGERDTSPRLPVHGHWEAAPNPYCATDRFTQAIVLTSYPRQLQAAAGSALSNDDSITNHNSQRHTLVLHGRLAGRYARPGPRGRLTHGKVLRQEMSVDATTERRPILASFDARQLPPVSPPPLLDDDAGE